MSGRKKKAHPLFAWLRLIRLPFYVMTLFSYTLGAVACAEWTSLSFEWPFFLVGFACLFFGELATVLFNEFYDQETDALNENGSPFNGGSQVLREGVLSPVPVRRAGVMALVVAFGFGIALLLLKGNTDGAWESVSLMLIGLLLGPGYTVPPLRWVYRGWGELVVSIALSGYVIGCGWVFQGGWIGDARPWLLGVPMFFAILTSITLTALPDRDADLAVGKRTIAVRFTNHRGAGVTIAAAAAASVALLVAREGELSEAYTGLHIPVAIHATLMILLLGRFLREGAPCKRIDFLVVLSLLFSFWFNLGPLLNLLW